MDKNITISLSLFSRIIDFLGYLDISNFALDYKQEHDAILFALLKKKQSIELREAYARIVYAETDDARFDARMRYLQQKRDSNSSF